MRFFSLWVRKPLIHFMLIGALLFALQGIWRANTEQPLMPHKKDLVISTNQIEQFKKDISLQTGSRPTTEQLQRLVQTAIDDEVLYQEAIALNLNKGNPSIRRRLIDLAKIADETKQGSDDLLYKKALDLGLDRYDPVIRRLLISTMRLVAKKVPTHRAPANVASQELEAYYQANLPQFIKPVQVTFSHIYFSRDKRGAKGKAEAERILNELSSPGATLESVNARGDAFLGGQDFSWMTLPSLERLFGHAFSEALSKVTPGKWSGPINSSYGWHIVFVGDLRPARPSSLLEVRNQIKSSILQEREEQRLTETLERLRSRYTIVINDDSGPSV